MKKKIMTISGDNGAKKILEQNKNKLFNCETNNGSITENLNTQASFN